MKSIDALGKFICCFGLAAVLMDSVAFAQTQTPGNSEAAESDEASPIEFLEDKSLPVVTYGYRGLKRSDRDAFEPWVQIFQDGTVKCPERSGMPYREAKLSEKEVRDMFDLIFNRTRIYDISTADLDPTKTTSKAYSRIEFQVSLKRGDHAVAFRSIASNARKFPDDQKIQSMALLETRMKQVVSKANFYAIENYEELLGNLNKDLEKQQPGNAPFNLNELNSATHRGRGHFYAQFSRSLVSEDSNANPKILRGYITRKSGETEFQYKIQLRELSRRGLRK